MQARANTFFGKNNQNSPAPRKKRTFLNILIILSAAVLVAVVICFFPKKTMICPLALSQMPKSYLGKTFPARHNGRLSMSQHKQQLWQLRVTRWRDKMHEE